jgi:hypothetical protein
VQVAQAQALALAQNNPQDAVPARAVADAGLGLGRQAGR